MNDDPATPQVVGGIAKLTYADVVSATQRLERSVRKYKKTKKLYDKQEVVASYIQILSMKHPGTYDRKAKVGIMNRHYERDSLHKMEEDAFLRRVSEILMNTTEGV